MSPRTWWLVAGVLTVALGAVTGVTVADRMSRDGRATGGIAGDCNAQGARNTVSCNILPPPRTLGDVSLSQELRPGGMLIFAGPVGEMPTPPDYSNYSTMAHCDAWEDWIKAQPRIYPTDPIVWAGLTTGADDLVVIRKVTAEVFRRTLATTVTPFRCDYGGGFTPGYLIELDTVRQRTRFQVDGEEKYYDMPPGSITLHGLGHEGASIVFESPERYLYEGAVTVATEINGVEQKLAIGSLDMPIRWTAGGLSGSGNGGFVTSLGAAYDWNPHEQRWVQVTTTLPEWGPS